MDKRNLEIYTESILCFSDIENIDIVKHLMQIVFIENNNAPIKRNILIDRLSEIIKLKFNEKIKNFIQTILDDGLKKEIFVHNGDNDTYNMSSIKFQEVYQYMDNVLTLKKKFFQDFISCVQIKNKTHAFFSNEQLDIIFDNLELILYTYFYENGLAVFKKIRNLDVEDFITDDDNLKKVVYRILNKYDIGVYPLVELHKIIVDFLTHLDNDNIDYIVSLLQKTVFVKLFNTLNVKSEKSLLENRSFYLDTNILIALLFDNHKRNKEVDYIIKVSRDLGINLKITEKTLEEYRRQFEYLIEVDRRLNDAKVYQSPRLIKVITSQSVDNDIYEFYLNNRKSFKDFNSFVSAYCENISSFLNLFKIQVEKVYEEVYIGFHQEKEYDILFEELKLLKSKDYFIPNDLVVEHDLKHLYFIKYIRQELNDSVDSFGYKNWFLTLEGKIEKFRYIYRDTFISPLWMTVNDLYDLLLPFLVDTIEVNDEYIKHQLNSKLGFYNNNDKSINLDILSCVLNSGIDIEKFEKLDNKEAIELIYNIQSNNKVQRLCKFSKDAVDDVEQNVLDEIKSSIHFIIEEKNRETEKNSEKSQIKQLAKELEEKEIENEELKKFKEKFEDLQMQISLKKPSVWEIIKDWILSLIKREESNRKNNCD